MRRVTAFLLLSLLICGCKFRFAATSSFGDGEAILKEVYASALAGYKLEFEEFNWSGSSGNDEFSRNDQTLVENARIQDIADKLASQLKLLPSKRSWKAYGSGRTGDRFLRIDYEEKGAQFYMDFILTQIDNDVEIVVLYKGVRR